MAFGQSKPDTDRRRDRRSSSMGRSALDWLVPIIESVPKRSFQDIGRFGFILSSSQAGRIGTKPFRPHFGLIPSSGSTDSRFELPDPIPRMNRPVRVHLNTETRRERNPLLYRSITNSLKSSAKRSRINYQSTTPMTTP